MIKKPLPKLIALLQNSSTNSTRKNQTSTKESKKTFAVIGIVAAIVCVLAVISVGVTYAAALKDQSRLENDNIPITIFGINDEVELGYHTDSHEISGELSGVSTFAQVTIGNTIGSLIDHHNNTAKFKHRFENIPEGKRDVVISVVDGNRHTDKTITFKRQTKAEYDKQKLEEALKKAEESTKKAEAEPTDEHIEGAKLDIKNLPDDKRTPFSERIAKLEKAKQEEKERAEKAKKDAEEQKNRAEQAAAAAAAAKRTRQQQIQQQRQRQAVVAPAAAPAQNQAAGVFFRNCKEARAAGYSNMSRGTPGYREELDRDHDGIACER